MIPNNPSNTPAAGSLAQTPAPTPTPTSTQGSVQTTPVPTPTPSLTNAPNGTSKAGRRLIFKKAIDDLIHDALFMMEREKLESGYRGQRPGANARTDRSDAGELRNRYSNELYSRAVAIKDFILEELAMNSDGEIEYLFNSLSNEAGNESTGTVEKKLQLCLGWIAENGDRL